MIEHDSFLTKGHSPVDWILNSK